MKKSASVLFFLILTLIIVSNVFALEREDSPEECSITDDDDQDGVPNYDRNCNVIDVCPNSGGTTDVDQFGCSCEQACVADDNPCTDTCGVTNGLASCNVFNENSCEINGRNGYCERGECRIPETTGSRTLVILVSIESGFPSPIDRSEAEDLNPGARILPQSGTYTLDSSKCRLEDIRYAAIVDFADREVNMREYNNIVIYSSTTSCQGAIWPRGPERITLPTDDGVLEFDVTVNFGDSSGNQGFGNTGTPQCIRNCQEAGFSESECIALCGGGGAPEPPCEDGRPPEPNGICRSGRCPNGQPPLPNGGGCPRNPNEPDPNDPEGPSGIPMITEQRIKEFNSWLFDKTYTGCGELLGFDQLSYDDRKNFGSRLKLINDRENKEQRGTCEQYAKEGIYAYSLPGGQYIYVCNDWLRQGRYAREKSYYMAIAQMNKKTPSQAEFNEKCFGIGPNDPFVLINGDYPLQCERIQRDEFGKCPVEEAPWRSESNQKLRTVAKEMIDIVVSNDKCGNFITGDGIYRAFRLYGAISDNKIQVFGPNPPNNLCQKYDMGYYLLDTDTITICPLALNNLDKTNLKLELLYRYSQMLGVDLIGEVDDNLAQLKYEAMMSVIEDLCLKESTTSNQFLNGQNLLPFCLDSDSGLDYSTQGNVQTNIDSGTDCCTNGDNVCLSESTHVKEYFCNSDDTKGYEIYQCAGRCSDGRCIAPQERTTPPTTTPPVLSVGSFGNNIQGNVVLAGSSSVQINQGDPITFDVTSNIPSSQVLIYATNIQGYVVFDNVFLGYTDSNGEFSRTISDTSNWPPNTYSAHVTINGLSSNEVRYEVMSEFCPNGCVYEGVCYKTGDEGCINNVKYRCFGKNDPRPLNEPCGNACNGCMNEGKCYPIDFETECIGNIKYRCADKGYIKKDPCQTDPCPNGCVDNNGICREIGYTKCVGNDKYGCIAKGNIQYIEPCQTAIVDPCPNGCFQFGRCYNPQETDCYGNDRYQCFGKASFDRIGDCIPPDPCPSGCMEGNVCHPIGFETECIGNVKRRCASDDNIQQESCNIDPCPNGCEFLGNCYPFEQRSDCINNQIWECGYDKQIRPIATCCPGGCLAFNVCHPSEASTCYGGIMFQCQGNQIVPINYC